jgi:hypothetical protein
MIYIQYFINMAIFTAEHTVKEESHDLFTIFYKPAVWNYSNH